MDSPCIKQTVCKVLKIFQHGKYLVAYVLKNSFHGDIEIYEDKLAQSGDRILSSHITIGVIMVICVSKA